MYGPTQNPEKEAPGLAPGEAPGKHWGGFYEILVKFGRKLVGVSCENLGEAWGKCWGVIWGKQKKTHTFFPRITLNHINKFC